MDKNGNITISNPQKGVANSALLGNEAIIGCDIFEEPGVLKIQTSLEADASDVNNPAVATLTGVMVADVTSVKTSGLVNRTVVTETGQIFGGTNANFLLATQSFGWDACVWNGDLTVVSYAAGGVGYIGVIYYNDSGGVYWFGSKISSLDGSHYIKLLMGKDGYIYFTNGNTIGRITNVTYDSGTGAVTVTSTSNALDLPPNTYAVTMTELGNKLLIGTQKGNSYSVRQAYQGADIIPWDRVSASFSLPVEVNENGINAMISHKNRVYFSAGNSGNIYETDGTQYQLIKRLPYNRQGYYVSSSYAYPNAMCINQRGNLLVGLSAQYDTNSPTKTGIWEIALTQGYPTHLPFFSRDGNLGDVSTVKFGSVRVLDANSLGFGIQSGNTYELSRTSATALNSGYTAKWRTEMFMVGTRTNRKSFNKIEFTLLEPLLANQGIKIAYRKNKAEDFTTIGTFTFATLGSVISHETKALIADAEMVQFEISLDYTNSIFGNNINLIRIILS